MGQCVFVETSFLEASSGPDLEIVGYALYNVGMFCDRDGLVFYFLGPEMDPFFKKMGHLKKKLGKMVHLARIA